MLIRVALLCAARAPGLDYLLEQHGEHGRSFELVVGVTSDPTSSAVGPMRRAGIPTLIHDIAAFYASRGARRTDLAVRRDYDTRTVELLRLFRPDVIVLSGYLHIVTAPLLSAYPGRVINVHDADLTILGPDGHPKYRGLHATRDAIRAGEPTTRCTLHLVTENVDGGPALLQSPEFPVRGRHHYVQREWMMHTAWGPLIARAIELFAREAALPAPAAVGM